MHKKWPVQEEADEIILATVIVVHFSLKKRRLKTLFKQLSNKK